jgi:hypothetical protein
MAHLREGWQAAVDALERDGRLSPVHSNAQATDILWSLLTVESWEHLTIDCGWSQRRYVETMKIVARQVVLR